MPATAANGKDLLDTVRRMTSEEFDAFLGDAMSLRALPKATLSAQETKLIKRINRGLPEKLTQRHALLSQRLRGGRLTEKEHQELLALTSEAENLDADRAAALLELAKLRRLPVRALMKQMGIQAPPIHG
jgi:hypothetical protein